MFLDTPNHTPQSLLRRSQAKKTILTSAAVSAFALAAAHATFYYVDPAGVDDTAHGTSAAPWKTVAYALSQTPVNAGNTIHLNAGTYVVAGPLSVGTGLNLEGAGQAATTVRSSNTSGEIFLLSSGALTNGNQSIKNLAFDGNNRANAHALHIQNRNNVLVDHVNFTSFGDWAADVSGAGWGGGRNNRITGFELSNFNMTNCGGNTTGGFKVGALVIGTTTGAKVHDFTIDSTGLGTHGIKYDWGAAGDDRGGGYNFGLKIYDGTIKIGGDGFSIEEFNSYANGTDPSEIANVWADHMFSLGGNKDATLNQDNIVDNRVHHNTMMQTNTPGLIECQCPDVEVDHNYCFGDGQWGITVWVAGFDPGDDITRRNYFFHDNVFRAATAGLTNTTSIEFQSMTVANLNAWVYNNTFDSVDRGVYLHTNSGEQLGGIHILNNVFKNATREGIQLYKQTGGTFNDLTITNNDTIGGHNSNNLVGYYSVAPSDVSGLSVANNYSTDPGLVLSGNSPDPYYRPAAAGSLVVDKGTAAVAPNPSAGSPLHNRAVVGTAPDIGAFEFGNSTDVVGKSAALVFEAEALSVVNSSGDAYRIITGTGFSGGSGAILDGNAAGDYLTYLVPSINAGTYDVRIGVKDFNTRAIVQTSIGRADNFSGTQTNVGAAFDEYNAAETYAEVDLGTWSPVSSTDKWFRFTATGKNSASSLYSICIDYIKLVPR